MELVIERTMPAVDRDQELIAQIICESAVQRNAALQQLYDAYGQRMYAYALTITGDPSGAEEAVQESLVAVWQGAGRFRGGRLIAWLLGIVHHKALNQIRGRRVESLEAVQREPADHQALPDELAAAGEQRQMIRTGLRALSLEHRTVLELVFYQGLSLNEVAEVVNCPVGTVKSRLNQAKQSLRGILSRAGYAVEEQR